MNSDPAIVEPTKVRDQNPVFDPDAAPLLTGPRRPVDEFYDLKTIVAVKEQDVYGDGSVTIYTEVEGAGSFAEETDTVQYRHETRFDNGQLVDLNEKRKVADNFLMDDERSFTYLRDCFKIMQRGQIAFLKIE